MSQYVVSTLYYHPTWNGGVPVSHVYGPFTDRKAARRFQANITREDGVTSNLVALASTYREPMGPFSPTLQHTSVNKVLGS